MITCIFLHNVKLNNNDNNNNEEIKHTIFSVTQNRPRFKWISKWKLVPVTVKKEAESQKIIGTRSVPAGRFC